MGITGLNIEHRTFDMQAEKVVKGEGCGVVLLKPLQKALSDNDYIYGVWEATTANHVGQSLLHHKKACFVKLGDWLRFHLNVLATLKLMEMGLRYLALQKYLTLSKLKWTTKFPCHLLKPVLANLQMVYQNCSFN